MVTQLITKKNRLGNLAIINFACIMQYWKGNQTYIITNCDAITMATCMLVEDEILYHKVSRKHTICEIWQNHNILVAMASPPVQSS